MSKFKCVVCGRKADDLRFNTCFDCAEAESIIDSGYDMYDIDYNGNVNPGNTDIAPMCKLKYLIKKGWRLQKELKPSKRISAARRNNRSSRRKA